MIHHLENELNAIREENQRNVGQINNLNQKLHLFQEQLQDLKEKLNISRNELKLLNKELIRVNSQLQFRVEEIEAANNNLVSFVSSINIPAIFLDEQIKILYFTDAITGLFSFKSSDIGRSFTDYHEEPFGEGVLNDVYSVLSDLTLVRRKLVIKDLLYICTVQPYRKIDKSVQGVVITFVNIFDSIYFEEQLHRERDILQAIIDAPRNFHIAYLDRDFNFILVNKTYAKGSGYSPEELVGKNHFALFPNKENEKSFRYARDNVVVIEYHDRPFIYQGDPNRGTTYWDWTITPIRNKNGDVNGLVLALIETTQRKKVEDALRDSEQRFHAAVDNYPSVFIIYDKERRVNFMNKAGVAISGKLPEDVIGYNDEEICPPEVDKEYIDRLRKTYLTKEPQHFEHSFILKGKKMSHVVDYIPLLDDNGQIRQVLGIAVDVTERKEFEEMLKRRTSELASSNNELEAFSYSVSHDLRSPLHTLKGFTELLFEDYESKLDETARDYLRRIVNSANKMNALINDMLRLSRISRQDISMQEINLSMLAREIIDELSEQHPERHVEVIIHDKLKIKGDKQLLKIALMNLLGNAWKYTSKTTEPRIEFGSCQQNNKTVFFIHDNGAGFPMEQADKLFTPFQRLHPEGEFSGTGIGLPIVERVIRRHDGKIWAEAELNKGATFFFTIDENIENTNDNNRRSGSVKNL